MSCDCSLYFPMNARPASGVHCARIALQRCTGLLLPSLFVHAEHEEPHNLRSCPEEAQGCNVGEQTVSERRIQEAQPTQTSKYPQHAQNSRQEGGPDKEVPIQRCSESERYQVECGAMVIHLEAEERQHLQLFRAQCRTAVR